MTRLFVDLDVLADFEAGFVAIAGMPSREFEELHGTHVLWKRVADAPGFFEALPWAPGGRELWDGVAGNGVFVLAGLPAGTWAEPQKRAWCRRELGEAVPVICCPPIDKHKFAVTGDILIAPRGRRRLDWETAGGKFVQHRSSSATLKALRELGRAAAPEPQAVQVAPPPKIYRSAVDGRFVTEAYALANPDTTYSTSG